MFYNPNHFVEVLCELNITANQFLLCHLLYWDNREEFRSSTHKKSLASLYKYASSKTRRWKTTEVDDLIEKGYLKELNTSGPRSADMMEVDPSFITKVYASYPQFEEFWDLYPKVMASFDGSRGSIKLKMCDKDELEKSYLRLVTTKKLHNNIMELLKWGINNHQINMGIEKFVKSRQWETLEDLQAEYADDNMRIAR